jgi:hypothetical protein
LCISYLPYRDFDFTWSFDATLVDQQAIDLLIVNPDVGVSECIEQTLQKIIDVVSVFATIRAPEFNFHGDPVFDGAGILEALELVAVDLGSVSGSRWPDCDSDTFALSPFGVIPID